MWQVGPMESRNSGFKYSPKLYMLNMKTRNLRKNSHTSHFSCLNLICKMHHYGRLECKVKTYCSNTRVISATIQCRTKCHFGCLPVRFIRETNSFRCIRGHFTHCDRDHFSSLSTIGILSSQN